MTWRERLLDKWPYKVAAVVLAMLLWVNVTDDEVQEHVVRTRLEYDVRDPGWVLVEGPEEIGTAFRGRRADIVAFNFDRPTLRLTIDEVTDSVMRVGVSLEDLATLDAAGATLRAVGVNPSTVTLKFEPVAEKSVRVLPTAQPKAAEGFVIVGPMRVEPDSVRLVGAASQVASLETASTESVQLPPLDRSIMREVEVNVPPDLEHVTAVPSSVLLTIEVDSLLERQLLVPLAVEGTAAEEVLLSTDSVLVRVSGPGRDVAALDSGELLASVRVDRVPPRATPHPVQVSLPDHLTLTAVAAEPEVVVRARDGSSSLPPSD